jgi:oligoendopeptidase F
MPLPYDVNQLIWDTSRLYPSPQSEELAKDFAAIAEQVQGFRERYAGQLYRLDAGELCAALSRYESLHEQAVKLQSYTQLLFAADSEDDAVKALSQRADEFGNGISRKLLFFDLEIMALADGRFDELINSAELAPFRHYLENTRRYRPHTLPERDEQLLKQKNLTGVEAFTRLFDEVSASFRYRFTFDGEERECTGEELLGLLHHHEADIREAAFATFLNRHAEEGIVLGTIFNTVALDHGQELELRGYGHPMEPTNLANELPLAVVERLLEVTEANCHLAQGYFRLKAELLGVPRLKNSDIYAPISSTDRRYTFDEAKQLVVEAYAAFHPPYAAIIEAFFSEGRIDALPRPGKGGGAFCMGITPQLPPYVLLNFTGNLRDVATLAHELGHGLHFVMAQRQSMLNYHPPLPLAETASVFGEMLLTRMLLQRETDPAMKIELLCAKIEDIIATTFRQVVLTRFEERFHLERRQGLLSTTRLGEIWWEENGKLYGDAVEMIPPYHWGWSYISHFIHARFYCYSYTFAELLVLSLYQQYLQDETAFIPRYETILGQGGSLSPAETIAPSGLSLSSPDFWQKGYDLLESLLAELKALISEQR